MCGNKGGKKNDRRFRAKRSDDLSDAGRFIGEDLPENKETHINAQNRPNIEAFHQIHADRQAGQNRFGPGLRDGFGAQCRQGQKNHAGGHVPYAKPPAGIGKEMHVQPGCDAAQQTNCGVKF